ncbi:MAG: DUF3263 domain-containing protein [Acidimicrobiia bacterium]
MASPLNIRERAILDLEGTWWRHDVPKATVIREHLGMSPTRYYELLSLLLASEAAYDYDPLTVARARRDRARRRRIRHEGHQVNPRS